MYFLNGLHRYGFCLYSLDETASSHAIWSVVLVCNALGIDASHWPCKNAWGPPFQVLESSRDGISEKPIYQHFGISVIVKIISGVPDKVSILRIF